MMAILHSGTRIDLNRPRAEAITIDDIAVPLSKMPMDRGAAWSFYSIAQHSMLVAQQASRRFGALPAMYALLHHAGEAFEDQPRTQLLRVIHKSFGLEWPVPREIAAMLACAHDTVEMGEWRQIYRGREADVEEMEARGVEPLRFAIRPLSWDRALSALAGRPDGAIHVAAVAAGLANLPVFRS